MHAEFIAVDAELRLAGYLDLGDQIADGRIRAGKFDAGGFADQAASTVAPDEILCAQKGAVGQPPAITTACQCFAAPMSSLHRHWIGRAFYGISGVLKQAPWALHIRVGDGPCLPIIL